MQNEQDIGGNAKRMNIPTRNWSLIIGRIALVWALIESLMAGLANMSGGSLFGFGEQHFSLDAVVAALVGIGFVVDGAARRIVRNR